VLIRDFSDTPGCDNCLRVSVGTPEQNERFLETLSTVLR
jgi:histidinol-phosphate aminotransferase